MVTKLTEANKFTEVKLEPNTEYRFEVEKGPFEIQLLDGIAELFGTELTKEKIYTFHEDVRSSVFTYHGCTLGVRGTPATDPYVATQSPMHTYLNVHTALEQLRRKSETDKVRGPRIMVAGPTDVGKSTLCRILVNYAVRQGSTPIYVDVDIGQGDVSIPGTIGCIVVERPIDVDEPFANYAPLVFHFGSLSPEHNVELYKAQVTRLAECVDQKCKQDARIRRSGVIVNTCGWVRDGGYSCLLHCASAFDCDVIAVLDAERLFNELERDVPRTVKCVLLPKSGGVVERSRSVRQTARDSKVKRYFYGTRLATLFPHSFDVNFRDVKIYRIGMQQLPTSLLPMGMQMDAAVATRPILMSANETLRNRVLSISQAQSIDDDAAFSNVIGYVVVQHVDMHRQALTVLAPAPQPLPRNFLFWSDLQLIE